MFWVFILILTLCLGAHDLAFSVTPKSIFSRPISILQIDPWKYQFEYPWTFLLCPKLHISTCRNSSANHYCQSWHSPSSLWLIHSEIMLILPTKSGFSLYSLIFFFVFTASTQLWTLFNFRLDYFHNLLISFLAFGFSKAVSQLLGLSNQLILDHVTLILTSIQKVLAACRVKLQFYSPKIWTQFTSFIFLTLKCAQLHLTAIPHPTHINASSSLLIMDLSLVLKQKYFESSYCLPYVVVISPGFQVIQT